MKSDLTRKTTMKKSILYSVCVISLGCAAQACGVTPEPPGGDPQERPAPSPETAELKAKVNFARVSMPSALAGLRRQMLHRAERVAEALQGLDGAGPVTLTTLSDGGLDGRVGQKMVRTYADRGLIVIQDDRGDEASPSEAPDEARLLPRARPLLDALGVDEKEMVWKLVGAGAMSMEKGQPAGPSERIATKLYIERTVAGLQVAEDRLVVTFALDGSLRKVVGRWRPLDGRIGMAKAWTVPEIVDRAVSLVEQRGQTKWQPLNPARPVDVETMLVPKPLGSGIWTLEMAGQATIHTGPSDSVSKPIRLDFAL
jgi:hypothetical protein